MKGDVINVIELDTLQEIVDKETIGNAIFAEGRDMLLEIVVNKTTDQITNKMIGGINHGTIGQVIHKVKTMKDQDKMIGVQTKGIVRVEGTTDI